MQLKRVSRSNVDAQPNELATNSAPVQSFAMDGYSITNSNTTDVFVHFYDSTSGTVTVGTTSRAYGAVLIPAAASGYSTQVVIRANDQSNPLQFFNTAITVAATTTESGSTSPTSDVTVELFYWSSSS